MGKLSIIIRSGTRENDREEPAERQYQQRHQHQHQQHHRQEHQQRQQQEQQQCRSCRGSIDGSTTLDGTGLSWCAGGGGSSATNSSALRVRAATARCRPLGATTPRSGTRGRPPRAATALETFRDGTTETASDYSYFSSYSSSVFTSYRSSSIDSNSVVKKNGKGEVFVVGENSTTPFSSSSYTFSRRSTRIISGSLLLALLAMSVLCEPVLGVPAPSSSFSSSSSSSPTSYELRQHQTNASSRFLEFDEGYEEEVDEPTATTASNGHSSSNVLGDEELEIIRRSIVESLGLQRIPDPSKANVSQTEYERAHREYLKKVQLSQQHQEPRKRRKLHVFHATEHPGNRTRRDIVEDDNEIVHRLFFPVEIPDVEVEDSTVDHASLRFLLAGHHRSMDDDLEIVVYLREEPEEGGGTTSRSPIARRTIRLDDPRDSRWLELDVTDLATAWLVDERKNLGLDLQFLRQGLPTRRVFALPVLNVFTTSYDSSIGRRRKRGVPGQPLSLHKGRRTECRGDNKKCCRHEMTVIFKDLQGFEFIVQPKKFDAGYCKGRCPPRYNPAHHHALLQSLIWKEDRRKAPRPCCAPSKLAELEILYFDENNSTSLKVSSWNNMRVLECACS